MDRHVSGEHALGAFEITRAGDMFLELGFGYYFPLFCVPPDVYQGTDASFLPFRGHTPWRDAQGLSPVPSPSAHPAGDLPFALEQGGPWRGGGGRLGNCEYRPARCRSVRDAQPVAAPAPWPHTGAASLEPSFRCASEEARAAGRGFPVRLS